MRTHKGRGYGFVVSTKRKQVLRVMRGGTESWCIFLPPLIFRERERVAPDSLGWLGSRSSLCFVLAIAF